MDKSITSTLIILKYSILFSKITHVYINFDCGQQIFFAENLNLSGGCLRRYNLLVLQILIYTRRQINQDRMIFGDFPVNSESIFLKFCKGHFLFKS